MSDIANIITLDERSRLYQLEETIRQGLNTFVDVGNALDGYAAAHPEIQQFRIEGSPSVSVRKA
jgi:hypothetical protein